MPHRLLLASGSPQRRAILGQIGMQFRVVVPEVEELEAGEPAAVASENARRKALACADQAAGDELVVAVDTIVVLDGVVHGKPRDVDDAARILQLLQGRTHRVFSGLCLLDRAAGEEHDLLASTSVTFRNFTVAELNRYLAGGEWAGRAGGYAIQGSGAVLVDSISGCYQNVVGFPVAAFCDLLDARGLAIARARVPASG